MHAIPNNAPSNVAALDDRDPEAGNSCHLYAIQYGSPNEIVKIQFQHGARSTDGSIAGIFDDDLLAIIQDRLEGFQSGPYACQENAKALEHVIMARLSLGQRVAARITKGVLGLNKQH